MEGRFIGLSVDIFAVINVKHSDIVFDIEVKKCPIVTGDAEGVDAVERLAQLFDMEARVAQVGYEESNLFFGSLLNIRREVFKRPLKTVRPDYRHDASSFYAGDIAWLRGGRRRPDGADERIRLLTR